MRSSEGLHFFIKSKIIKKHFEIHFFGFEICYYYGIIKGGKRSTQSIQNIVIHNIQILSTKHSTKKLLKRPFIL